MVEGILEYLFGIHDVDFHDVDAQFFWKGITLMGGLGMAHHHPPNTEQEMKLLFLCTDERPSDVVHC